MSTFYNGRKKKALEGLFKKSDHVNVDIVAEVDLALNGLQRSLAIEAGDDLAKVRLEAFGITNSTLPGGSVGITKGAKNLVENLAKTLPQGSIKLGKVVKGFNMGKP